MASELVGTLDSTVSLVCSSSAKPILCLWKTPYGHVYTLSQGVFAGQLDFGVWILMMKRTLDFDLFLAWKNNTCEPFLVFPFLPSLFDVFLHAKIVNGKSSNIENDLKILYSSSLWASISKEDYQKVLVFKQMITRDWSPKFVTDKSPF